MAAVLYVLVPLLPVLLAPLLFARAGARLLPFAPWLPLSAIALLPLRGDVVELPWLLLGTRLGIDAVAYPLLLLAIVTWTFAGWHARRTIEATGQARFFFFWLLTWCGNLSVFLTLDAASFYAAYAMVTFSAYGLVVHRGRAADYRAGRVYIGMSVLGEGLLLGGLLMLVAEAGNLPLGAGPVIVAGADNALAIALLMLLGFGVKIGLAGLHMWLPLAHPQAPVPASAVLSGVILKAGLVGWLRFLPLGQPGFEGLGYGLLALGLATALLGVLVGLTQQGVKSLLAYSSVSQMGLLALIVSLALLEPAGSPVYVSLAVFFALHHGLNKAALFVSVDALHGAQRPGRLLLWLPAMSLAGLPLTSGALAKAALKDVLPPEPSGLSSWLAVTSAATTVLMIRFLSLALRERARSANALPAAWLGLLAAGMVVPWAYAWLEQPQLAGLSLQPGHIFDASLPVGAGLLIGILIERGLRRRRLPVIPPGDLLHLLPRLPKPPRLSLPAWHWPDWTVALSWVELSLSALATAIIVGALVVAALVLV